MPTTVLEVLEGRIIVVVVSGKTGHSDGYTFTFMGMMASVSKGEAFVLKGDESGRKIVGF